MTITRHYWAPGDQLLLTTHTTKKTVVSSVTFIGYVANEAGVLRGTVAINGRPDVRSFTTTLDQLSGNYDLGLVE